MAIIDTNEEKPNLDAQERGVAAYKNFYEVRCRTVGMVVFFIIATTFIAGYMYGYWSL